MSGIHQAEPPSIAKPEAPRHEFAGTAPLTCTPIMNSHSSYLGSWPNEGVIGQHLGDEVLCPWHTDSSTGTTDPRFRWHLKIAKRKSTNFSRGLPLFSEPLSEYALEHQRRRCRLAVGCCSGRLLFGTGVILISFWDGARALPVKYPAFTPLVGLVTSPNEYSHIKMIGQFKLS